MNYILSDDRPVVASNAGRWPPAVWETQEITIAQKMTPALVHTMAGVSFYIDPMAGRLRPLDLLALGQH